MTTATLSSLFVFSLLLASAEANANQRWYVVNDSVMGGVSNSKMTQSEESLIFEGNLSLENNGGFASIRTQINAQGQNTHKIILRVKGDGQTYQLRLRTNDYLDGAAYARSFTTKNNEWLNITFIPSDFNLTYRGRSIPDQPEINFNNIKQLGLMIADKQEGNFKLEVAQIKFEN
jgi:hypothetical protein